MEALVKLYTVWVHHHPEGTELFSKHNCRWADFQMYIIANHSTDWTRPKVTSVAEEQNIFPLYNRTFINSRWYKINICYSRVCHNTAFFCDFNAWLLPNLSPLSHYLFHVYTTKNKTSLQYISFKDHYIYDTQLCMENCCTSANQILE